MAGANRCICERSSDYHFISCAKQSFLPVSQKLFKNMKTQAGETAWWVKPSPSKQKDVTGPQVACKKARMTACVGNPSIRVQGWGSRGR